MAEYLEVAWFPLLVLAVMCGFVVHGVRDNRRRHPHGYYRSDR